MEHSVPEIFNLRQVPATKSIVLSQSLPLLSISLRTAEQLYLTIEVQTLGQSCVSGIVLPGPQ